MAGNDWNIAVGLVTAALDDIGAPGIIKLILILILGVTAFAGIILCVRRKKKKSRRISYHKTLPKVHYETEAYQSLMQAYQIAGSIRGMLMLELKQCENPHAAMHFQAAIDYLEKSRYQDYETALFLYASDGEEQTDQLFEQIIAKEVQRKRGLPQKGDRST